MVKRKIMLGLVCAVVGLAVWALATVETTKEQTKNTKMRVGIFDSRAVAVAYAHSEYWSKIYHTKVSELEKAKAAGDNEKIKEIEAWGPTQQAVLHKQGFATASVRDLLECIKDKIPEIARETGVDIIVSKWDVVYQNPSVEAIDITNEIVKPFKPDQKCLEIIEDLANHPPVSEEVLEKMHCEQPIKDK